MLELTVEEVLELGLWGEICTLNGWSPWSINMGVIKFDEVVRIDESMLNNKLIKEDNDFIIICIKN